MLDHFRNTTGQPAHGRSTIPAPHKGPLRQRSVACFAYPTSLHGLIRTLGHDAHSRVTTHHTKGLQRKNCAFYAAVQLIYHPLCFRFSASYGSPCYPQPLRIKADEFIIDHYERNRGMKKLKAISQKEFPYSGCWYRIDQNVVLGQCRMSLQSCFNRLHRRLTECNAFLVDFVAELDDRMKPLPGHPLGPLQHS